MNSSSFSSTTMSRSGTLSPLPPFFTSSVRSAALRLARLDRAEHLAPLLDEGLLVAEVLQRDVRLVAGRAVARVLHVDAERELLAALDEAVAVAAPRRRPAR